jgi:hypothetical protein
MKLFSPVAVSSKQLDRLERIRAKGRTSYIFYRGILGWGIPVFLLNTLWRWREYGWQIPPRREFFLLTLVSLVVWTVMGYISGAWRWKAVFEERAGKDF